MRRVSPINLLGLNDLGTAAGFWTDNNAHEHGFVVQLNRGEIIGSFTDGSCNVHGFLFRNRRFSQFDAPGSSQTSAIGVMGTFINGVNDQGDIVGFFSDGTKVSGFVNFARTRTTGSNQ